MARLTTNVTLGLANSVETLPYRPVISGGGSTGDPANIVTTTVAADIATLVADGATPTQAHVTTLNGDWTALLALITTAKGGVSGDMCVTVDTSKVTTVSQLRALFNSILANPGVLGISAL